MEKLSKEQLIQSLSIFSEKQIETLKEIIKNGFWGDCMNEFADKKTYYSYGYETNLKKSKVHSGIVSGISKTIKSSGMNLIALCPNFWGDNTGDMMLFNMDLIDEKDLEEWARQ